MTFCGSKACQFGLYGGKMTIHSDSATDEIPLVGIIMGSSSDWDIMKNSAAILEEFGVTHAFRVVSAHRMQHDMVEYGAAAHRRELREIIAGAGAAGHRP